VRMALPGIVMPTGATQGSRPPHVFAPRRVRCMGRYAGSGDGRHLRYGIDRLWATAPSQAAAQSTPLRRCARERELREKVLAIAGLARDAMWATRAGARGRGGGTRAGVPSMSMSLKKWRRRRAGVGRTGPAQGTEWRRGLEVTRLFRACRQGDLS